MKYEIDTILAVVGQVGRALVAVEGHDLATVIESIQATLTLLGVTVPGAVNQYLEVAKTIPVEILVQMFKNATNRA